MQTYIKIEVFDCQGRPCTPHLIVEGKSINEEETESLGVLKAFKRYLRKLWISFRYVPLQLSFLGEAQGG